jgi:hypothetical protein
MQRVNRTIKRSPFLVKSGLWKKVTTVPKMWYKIFLENGKWPDGEGAIECLKNR